MKTAERWLLQALSEAENSRVRRTAMPTAPREDFAFCPKTVLRSNALPVRTRPFFPVALVVVLLGICSAADTLAERPGVYCVALAEKRTALSDADIEEGFELKRGDTSSLAQALEGAKSLLRGMRLYFEKDSASYEFVRASVATNGRTIVSFELSPDEYDRVRDCGLFFRDVPPDRNVFCYTDAGKIQLIKHKNDGFKGISCGLMKGEYDGDAFWLYSDPAYVDCLYDRYKMTDRSVQGDVTVLAKSNGQARAELVIHARGQEISTVNYMVNDAMVRSIEFQGSCMVGTQQLPRSVTIKDYVGAGVASVPKVVKEVTMDIVPSQTKLCEPDSHEMDLPMDGEIYCVDYRDQSTKDVMLAPNGAVRDLHPEASGSK